MPAKGQKDLQEIFDYNIDAFYDGPDFEWSIDGLNREIKEGWSLYSVKAGKHVVAAVFLRVKGDSLLTKNTSIRADFQGSGFSHQLKEFFEKKAHEIGAKKIYHYCRIDNFRSYTLNENHGYERTQKKLGEDLLGKSIGEIPPVEWIKIL